MARKHRNGAVQAPLPIPDGYDPIPNDTKLRWHNPTLTAEDKRWLETHPNELADILGALFDSLPIGFVFSTKYGVRDGVWISTIVCQNANHPAAAQAISVRGTTASRAALILAYFLFIGDGEPWWDAAGGGSVADW